ncbi:MAG TPA: NADH-quinone oxidoreductase subunit N [Thermoanaerobaculia bacterium]|nr:NADH-quinone oxidoreductase subunit N [Thermoanaerobaculia bacterium]HQR66162.1 NADH-quinone oxidoreductase subunit N [Thermoanaerobaculia bacterium]
MGGFLHVTAGDLAAVAPEIVLSAAGILLILLDAFARPTRASFPYVSLAALALANIVGAATTGTWFAGAVETSALTRFVEMLALGGAAFAILGGGAALARDGKNQGEFYALLLWSAAGAMLMTKGTDLLVIFIGLELMSIPLYVLAAWYREIPAATEAGMKYFLMGALSSAVLLYGVATLYGRTGTTSLTRLVGLAAGPSPFAFDPLVTVGTVAILAAVAFKLALVPFHSWAPDVYQGMTTPAVTFLSTIPKAAAAVFLVRLLHATGVAAAGDPWRGLLSLLAVASILFGNVVALSQRDLKRMLAYSGIAQMGYLAIALATFTRDALEGALVFLAGYLFSNAAAFLTVAALSSGETEPKTLADLAGLGKRNGAAAGLLTLSMVSLTGLPPTVGFIGKLLVFRSAVDAGLVGLALVGVFGSLVSVGYYLRVVHVLWMKEPSREVPLHEDDVMAGAAWLLLGAGVLIFGLFPRGLIDVARVAAQAFGSR